MIKEINVNNKRAFLHSSQFDDIWSKLELDDDDLRRLQNTIIKTPEKGNVIRGTGGFRKIRFSKGSDGKSGSLRVIYMDLTAYSYVYLLMVYPKSEKATLTENEKRLLKNISAATTAAFKNREVKWQ
jgi:hypothetical protein